MPGRAILALQADHEYLLLLPPGADIGPPGIPWVKLRNSAQPPDETPWPVEPKPPRATAVEVPLRPAAGTDAPGECSAVDVVVCVDDDRPQVEPPDEPQRE